MCGSWEGQERHVEGLRRRPLKGLAAAVQTRPHDTQDGDDEQDGEGHRRADEGGGEERGHDMEGER